MHQGQGFTNHLDNAMATRKQKLRKWNAARTARLKDIAARLKALPDEKSQIRWSMGYAVAMDEGIRDHEQAMLIGDMASRDESIVLEEQGG